MAFSLPSPPPTSACVMFGKKTRLGEKILEYNLLYVRSSGVFTLFMIHCYALLHGKISLLKPSHSFIVK